MTMYKVYGWKQPVDDEWKMEVIGWTTALALIPTDELLDAFSDAMAQVGAPKPLTPDWVVKVWNGLPGQGLGFAACPAHVLYHRQEPPTLALPGPAGDPDLVRANARKKAEELAANIVDPDLRQRFAGIMYVSLLPPELRPNEPGQKFRQDMAPAARPVRGGNATTGRAYLERFKNAGEAVPADIRAALERKDQAAAEPTTKGVNHASDDHRTTTEEDQAASQGDDEGEGDSGEGSEDRPTRERPASGARPARRPNRATAHRTVGNRTAATR